MAVSAEQVNALVWRYLRESGFRHAAFIFASESGVDPGESWGEPIPTGALTACLQWTLLYIGLERDARRALAGDAPHAAATAVEACFRPPEPARAASTVERDVAVSGPACAVLEGLVVACRWGRDGSRLAMAGADGSAMAWRLWGGRPSCVTAVVSARPARRRSTGARTLGSLWRAVRTDMSAS